MLKMIYDVIIVGGGAAGVFAALELAARSDLTVAILEKARRLNDARNIGHCWIGASARSAARIYSNPDVGGRGFTKKEWELFLSQFEHFYEGKLKFKRAKIAKRLINSLSGQGFDVEQQDYATLSEEQFIKASDRMHMVLRGNINIIHKVEVQEIIREDDGSFTIATDDFPYRAKNVVVATGRSSQRWWEGLQKNFKIPFTTRGFDLGVRIELPSLYFDKVFPKDWDAKLHWQGWTLTRPIKKMNVETEEADDIKICNSRTSSHGKRSHMSISIMRHFDADDPAGSQHRLCALSNVLSDFQLSREPVSKLIQGESILSPISEYAAFCEPISKFAELVPELITRGIFYSPEANLNIRKYKVGPSGQTAVPGLYMIGDMTGYSTSFAQAAIQGIKAAVALTKAADPIKTKKKREVLRYDLIEEATRRKSKKNNSPSVRPNVAGASAKKATGKHSANRRTS